jgi:hypothetical protein
MAAETIDAHRSTGLTRLIDRFPGHRALLQRGLARHDLVGLIWAYELADDMNAETPDPKGDMLLLQIEAEIFVELGRQMIGLS